MATMGSFAMEGSIAGPMTLYAFAVLGWLMSSCGYPVAAVVVGLLLGRLIETELLRAWQLSGGDISEILNHPWAIVIFVLMVLSLGFAMWQDSQRRRTEDLTAPG
jgi:putative tricarboxylic transport membrane protein